MKKIILGVSIIVVGVVSRSFADASLDSLLVRLAADTSDFRQFQTAVSTDSIREMDSDWKVKSETVIDRRITPKDSTMGNQLIKAVQFEKGETKDITAQMAEEEKKEKEKRQAKEKSKDDGKSRSFSLGGDELFPFSTERRPDFVFTTGDSVVDGRGVIVLSAEPKKKGEKLYHARYVIERDSLRVFSADLIPTKYPTFVKEMRIRLDFVPDRPKRVLRRFAMRVYANAIIKKFRMEVVTTLHDFVW
jgi:uncharacterized protein with PIN domain